MQSLGSGQPVSLSPGRALNLALVSILLASSTLLGIRPAEGSRDLLSSGISLAGVHWYSDDSGMLGSNIPWGQKGWNVEVIYDSSWCDGDRTTPIGNNVRALAQRARDDGLVNIIRIDYRNYQAVPRNGWEYGGWVSEFTKCISELSDVSIRFVVGNEPNAEGGFSARQYADAFDYLYARKPGGVRLLVAGPSGFSPVSWFGAMLNDTTAIDGMAIHSYGNPLDTDVDGNHCDDPRRSCRRVADWSFDGGFQYFKDLINQVPTRYYSKPVYITEFNTDVNGPNAWPNPSDNYQEDWINKAFDAVRAYNAGRGSKPKIHALVWFVDRDDGGWASFALRNISQAREDMACEFGSDANRGGSNNPCLGDSPPPPSGPPGSVTGGRTLSESGSSENPPSGASRNDSAVQPGQTRQAERYWGTRGMDMAAKKPTACSSNRNSIYLIGWHQGDLSEYLVNFPSAAATYRITAVGLPDDPYDQANRAYVLVNMFVDGRRVGSVKWDDGNPRCNEGEGGNSLKINLSGYRGVHAVAFEFANDFYEPPFRDERSRDFYFDYFKFDQVSGPPAPTPPPSGGHTSQLHGTVLRANGSREARLYVSVWRHDGGQFLEGYTNSQGIYEFTGLDPNQQCNIVVNARYVGSGGDCGAFDRVDKSRNSAVRNNVELIAGSDNWRGEDFWLTSVCP